MNKEDYSKYLNHPLWKEKRNEVFLKYGKKCSVPDCDSQGILEIHHKTYSPGKMPWEYPAENFVVFCAKHHKNHHGYEYKMNLCKKCSKEIDPRFDYCLSCLNKLIEEKETEKNKLEGKIANLETSLVKEKNKSNNQEADRLRNELKQLMKDRDKNDKIITELKRMDEFKEQVREDNKRLESKINLLIKALGISAAIILIVFFISLNGKDTENNVSVVAQKETAPINKEEDYSENNITNNDTQNLADKTSVNKEIIPYISESPIKNENTANVLTPAQSHQSTYKIISIDEINVNMGNNVQLSEKISQVSYSQNGNVYLNIGGKFPINKMACVIFKRDVANFGDLKRYENKLVKIKGKLYNYKGRVQIIINYNWQLQEI